MGCVFAIDRPKALRYKPRHTGRDNGLAGAMNSRLISASFQPGSPHQEMGA
jgi:hypothetical protein